MRLGFDAAYPQIALVPELPAGSIVGGYIGGATPHVWTDAEWAVVRGQGSLRPLPIFVAGEHCTGYAPGADVASSVVETMQRLGMAGHFALDVELRLPDDDWFYGLVQTANEADAGVVLYGTTGTVRRLQGSYDWSGTWVACVGGVLDITSDGWQYAFGSVWDYSVWDDAAPACDWVTPAT